ncbi:LOW QUALITY PROTEIN: forkhead box protein M1 [Diretmus argenteus]
MRRSPRRPLILKRRKLPFQQNDLPETASQKESDESRPKEPSKTPASQCFPDGIRIMDHPTMPDTQVVVIPKTADLQSVIGALTVKGKECGPHGPNKFILLSGVNKELDCSPLDDSLTNIQWLGRMSTDVLGPDPSKKVVNKESDNQVSHLTLSPQCDAVPKQPMSERPPYSYMAMIQFAINSRKNRRMTLKEIYTWIEDHFPYFRVVAKPGWKNSIRHNLSLHDMFIRETTPDGKVSYWTIRPEANRCLTLDQVYKPGCDPTAPTPMPVLLFAHQQRRMNADAKKPPCSSERKMKPLLPRTDSYLVPIQLPVASSIYLSSSSSAQFPPSGSQQKRNSSRGAKRVRLAPKVECKVTQSHTPTPAVASYPPAAVEVKEEQVCTPVSSETPPAPLTREASSSRRKQRLVLPSHEEPVLLLPNSTFFDSGVASDASAFQDTDHQHEQDTDHQEQDMDHQHEQQSTCQEYSFKTPIKSSNHLASSTPSKLSSNVLPEPWRVTPLGKGSHGELDFSPIRTPGGPTVTPQRHDYTTFSFSSTPFKELPLFSSPRELLTSTCSGAVGPNDSLGVECLQNCSRELLQAGGGTPASRSVTEGLVLDTMNDSLSKILVDISFSGLEDEDLGMANISWSEFIPQLK